MLMFFGLMIAGGFVELPIERRGLDLAALADGAQRCVLAEQAEHR